ncbi:hypothetical protein [Thermoactinospora rubra]|uniref:hypothetical protein n=1 Tax=Thermoactinospora rubra TaxID=1088767 RepID=UPI00117C0FC5|nr:hypothetical protein [Thermoactinospora rubra]
MRTLRVVIGYVLAAVAVLAIAWAAYSARKVPVAPADAAPSPRGETFAATPGPSAAPGEPPEIATRVTVARATDADLARVPQGRIDVGLHQVKVTVEHTLTADAGQEALLRRIRTKYDFPASLQSETDALFGAVRASGAGLGPTTRYAPVLVTAGGKTTATYTLTMLRQVEPEELLSLTFHVPAEQPLLVDRRTIGIRSADWTVVQTPDFVPDKETATGIEVTLNPYPVRVSLAYRTQGFTDAHQDNDPSWAAALGVLTAIVLGTLLLRALSVAWWRPVLNRVLAAGIAVCAVTLGAAAVTDSLDLAAYLVLFALLPAVSLRHAAKVVPAPAPWTTTDLLVVTGAGVAVGGGMLIWSALYGQLPLATLVTAGTVAALAAAGSAVAFAADLGAPSVVVRLAVVAAGVALGALAFALWMRALMHGVFPPDSVRLMLALGWSLIPIAGIAVATRHWSRAVVAFGVLAGLLVQGWPTEWLDAGSWNIAPADLASGEPWPTPVLRGALGLLLLAFVLMVLRLRRLGTTPEMLANPVVQDTMMATLMVVYLTPRRGDLDVGVPLPLLAITSLVAWAGAGWLISGERPHFVEPRSPVEHRDLIREALHRRLLFQAKQELYRLGRGKLGAAEMTLEDFDRQRHDIDRALGGESHRPETAFTTSAGCTPWHNGVMAFAVTLVLTLPFAFIFGLPAGSHLSAFAFDARGLLALPCFGFLFGYFYPRIRGTQPMTKALHLMAAATATELSAYISAMFEPDIGVADKAQLVAIVVGQTALACIGLGLYWEWRIMHLAGEPWGRVRNIRSIRSLATPLIAVLIAVGTTAATTVAGQTVERILKGQEVTGQVP